MNKGLEGFRKHTPQLAYRRDSAGVGRRFEALHDPEIGLRTPDDLSNIDCRGIPGESEAAAAAYGRVYERVRLQGLHHPHQMVSRNPVRLADFVCGYRAIPMFAQV